MGESSMPSSRGVFSSLPLPKPLPASLPVPAPPSSRYLRTSEALRRRPPSRGDLSSESVTLLLSWSLVSSVEELSSLWASISVEFEQLVVVGSEKSSSEMLSRMVLCLNLARLNCCWRSARVPRDEGGVGLAVAVTTGSGVRMNRSTSTALPVLVGSSWVELPWLRSRSISLWVVDDGDMLKEVSNRHSFDLISLFRHWQTRSRDEPAMLWRFWNEAFFFFVS
uniref:(northern house mosquito) hypothetical protein n=1 Tax=Culex pipiens TaxID=7175 RepID=A0A8D8A8P9_CULPI